MQVRRCEVVFASCSKDTIYGATAAATKVVQNKHLPRCGVDCLDISTCITVTVAIWKGTYFRRFSGRNQIELQATITYIAGVLQ